MCRVKEGLLLASFGCYDRQMPLFIRLRAREMRCGCDEIIKIRLSADLIRRWDDRTVVS